MKIVYIFNTLALKGGIERIFCDKMNRLVRDHGHDVSFVTFQQGNHPMSYQLDERIKVTDLDTRFCELHRMNAVASFIKNICLRRKLKKRMAQLLNGIRPDIVIFTTADFYICECFLDLPYRFIVESHVCLASVLEENLHGNRLLKPFFRSIDHWHFSKMNKAKTLVTLTQADKRDWEKHIDTDIKIIPNFVTHYPAEIKPYSDRPDRIICAGRLDPQKGFDYLIEAWKRIADRHVSWRIDIFGEGALEDALNKKIADYHLEKSMEIHRPTDRIYDEYNNSSMYVLSSRYEGFALVLIEASSCGVPCVAFDCPNGPSELITHGDDGLVVPLADIGKLAESIEWMITHKEERQRMSRQARLKAQHYTDKTIMPQWIKLFEETVQRT